MQNGVLMGDNPKALAFGLGESKLAANINSARLGMATAIPASRIFFEGISCFCALGESMVAGMQLGLGLGSDDGRHAGTPVSHTTRIMGGR